MAIEYQWTDDLPRVARVRTYCYAHAQNALEQYEQGIRNDGQAQLGDYLIARHDGQDVGTTTSLSMTMWVRGAPVPCQGVAWVGTTKTHRRTGDGGTGGIASNLMRETLKKAREREQVVSALMPWRASFYEHFGYGIVERRSDWAIPLAIMPKEPCSGFRFLTPDDPLPLQARQSMVEAGQCDIERPAAAWGVRKQDHQRGFLVADGSKGKSDQFVPDSWMFLVHEQRNGKDVLRVLDWARSNIEQLRRQLAFLGTLKDQYDSAIIAQPADLQMNRLLLEPQVPHRPVNHPTADVRQYTRMQVRVLDHARLIQAMRRLPIDARGSATVAIRETEGDTSSIRIELEQGRATVRPHHGDADVTCLDRQWSPIVLGDLIATRAAELGLISVSNPAALPVLDAFSAGPAPFCNEYF